MEKCFRHNRPGDMHDFRDAFKTSSQKSFFEHLLLPMILLGSRIFPQDVFPRRRYLPAKILHYAAQSLPASGAGDTKSLLGVSFEPFRCFLFVLCILDGAYISFFRFSARSETFIEISMFSLSGYYDFAY